MNKVSNFIYKHFAWYRFDLRFSDSQLWEAFFISQDVLTIISFIIIGVANRIGIPKIAEYSLYIYGTIQLASQLDRQFQQGKYIDPLSHTTAIVICIFFCSFLIKKYYNGIYRYKTNHSNS